MNKRTIILLSIIALSITTYFTSHSIKSYFINERYYSILSKVYLVKPHFKPLKSFYDIFTQEGLSYKKNNSATIESSLNKLKTQKNKNIASIPTITHQIYFTAPEKPIALSSFYIENLKKTFTQLDKLNNSWTHNIWTNYPELFPNEIKNISNVKIRSIDEFKDDLLYKDLLNTLEKGIKAKAYFAESSDILRLLALKKFGGIYKDMDYEIYNPEALFDLMKKFDFIGGRERIRIKSYYGNSFIAAKPYHPIITEAVKLLHRNNHLTKDSPTYLKYPSIEFDRIYFNGPPLITIAYFKRNNIYGNADVILPPWMIYNKTFAHYKNNACAYDKMPRDEVINNNNNLSNIMNDFLSHYKNQKAKDGKLTSNEQNIYYNTKYRNGLPIIGADMFCGSWVPSNNFKKIYYWNIPFFKRK